MYIYKYIQIFRGYDLARKYEAEAWRKPSQAAAGVEAAKRPKVYEVLSPSSPHPSLGNH